MTLEQFANKYKLKARRSPEDDNELVINGKKGQIYKYSDNELAVLFMPPSKTDPCGKWCPKKWGNLRREAVASGMILLQNGDSEGSLSFNPSNPDLARLAIKISGARVKKQLSADHIAKLTAALASGRKKSTVERQLSIKNGPRTIEVGL